MSRVCTKLRPAGSRLWLPSVPLAPRCAFDKHQRRQLAGLSSTKPNGRPEYYSPNYALHRPPLDFISKFPRLQTHSHPPPPDHERPIDDTEWELRVGRAISVLTTTLPDFFKTGLITRFDSGPTTSPFAFVEAVHPSPDIIYARDIRLKYAPPEKLPPPFPSVLQIEGLSLYFASAVIVRTSLNALYHDMHVALKSIEILSPEPRERLIRIGFIVSGASRVGGSKAEWDILSTYRFSPASGLINQHDINSIHPAPHRTVLDTLQSSLAKLGLSSPPPSPTPVARVNVGECSPKPQH